MSVIDRPGAHGADSGEEHRGGDDGRRSRRRRRRRPRPVRWVANLIKVGMLAGVLLALYLGVTLVQVWQASRVDERPRSGAIVVLGAAQYDGKPSPALLARLEHALELYQDDVAPVIVVTGGKRSGDRYTEAQTGYNWLRRQDVPDEAILQEVQGTSTVESLQATARFLRTEGVDEVVLVSGPSHSYRVAAVAEEVGLTAHVSPAESAGASPESLVKETVAVSAGRLIGYGRLGRLDSMR